MFGRTDLADGLPRLYTYQDALNRYEQTKPLQSGHDKGLIPLGDNRRYKRSQMLKNAENGNIVCRFWNTDLITFKPNGEVDLFVGAWHSPTTMMFLEGVFGPRFRRYKGKIYFDARNAPKDAGRSYYLIHAERVLTVKGSEPINPLPEYTYMLNRAKMKEKQKQFEPFIKYIKNMGKMETARRAEEQREEVDAIIKNYGYDYFKNFNFPTTANVVGMCPPLTISRKDYKYRPQHQVIRHNYIERVAEACAQNDLEAFYPLYFILATNSAEVSYDRNINNYVYRASDKLAKKFFDELLKFEFTNIFDREEQPLGILVADSNAKYFL